MILALPTQLLFHEIITTLSCVFPAGSITTTTTTTTTVPVTTTAAVATNANLHGSTATTAV